MAAWRKVILAVCVVVMVVCGYLLADKYIEEKSSKNFIEDLKGDYVSHSGGSESDEPDDLVIDFDALKKVNSDIVGWIICEDTKIDYPIVRGRTNDDYLYTLYNGKNNRTGSIFMDYRNSSDFSDKNTVIYGHNMKNGSMFAALSDFKSNDYYNDHSVMYVYTPTQKYKLELISGYVTDADGEWFETFSKSDAEITQYMKDTMSKSTFKSDVVIGDNDRFVTLATCSYEYDDARYIVHARITKA